MRYVYVQSGHEYRRNSWKRIVVDETGLSIKSHGLARIGREFITHLKRSICQDREWTQS